LIVDKASNFVPLNANWDFKFVINGCDLLNRHELSSTQDRELQRYIDNNRHVLIYKDHELTSFSFKLPNSAVSSLMRFLPLGVNFTSDFPGLTGNSRMDDGTGLCYKAVSPSSPYGMLELDSGNSTMKRGGISKGSTILSPYGSLKSRKGVSWFDEERARSLSPVNNNPQVLKIASTSFTVSQPVV
uniref:LAM_G_DOMAIN domain-containing protein n=1 Tax=Angiostrongylus costaricensis TaxID=334426 RepID=A0A0R3PAS8_ANGCS